MLENKHNLTVDTQSKSIGNAFVEVVQNDNVALEVQIYNNNLLVDNTAYTYTLLSVLPSKERIIRQGSIGPNGYPVFYLGVEEMSETGIILAMVQVYDELGNRVTSYDFKYRMKEDLSTGGVVPSADNPKFVIITEDSLSQTVQDAHLSRQELDTMKTDTDGVVHLTPNDRLVSDYNKINTELGNKADATSVYTKKEVDNLLSHNLNAEVILRNELLNSNFKKGILHFDVYGGTFSTSNNGIIISSAKANNSVLAQVKDIRDNNKYYMLSTFKVLDSNVTTVQIMAYSYTINAINSPKLNIKQIISGVYTGNSSHIDVRIRASYTIGEGRQIVEIYNMLFVNLTLIFGAGNEPTKEEMDMLISILGGWFDGEITVTQKQYVTWLLNIMRQNRNAILALGGTIV